MGDADQGLKLAAFAAIAGLMMGYGWCIAGVAACSAGLASANTVLEVAIERDWWVLFGRAEAG